MIRIPLWKIIMVLILCVSAFAYAAPNLMSKEAREAWQTKVPSWLPSKTVNLGLDLQGGSHLLLEVGLDVTIKDNAENIASGLRVELRDKKIRYTSLRPRADGFTLTLRSAEDAEAARKVIRQLDQEILIEDGDADGTMIGTFSNVRITQIKDSAIEQSIEIVRRRVDETGTREPIIQRQGDNRIVVQLPGLDNPARIKELLGKTAKLGFHLVDQDATLSGRARVGSMTLPYQENPIQTATVTKRPVITGDMLTNAQPNFSEGQPVVSFQFNAVGTRRFCETSRTNIGKPFAIVLDNEIISSPVIREAICGGSGQISGGFTVQESADLSLLLRAGALPAPLKIVEERTVGPSLGADSVASGKIATLLGLLFVVIFMVLSYGLFGMFSSIALLTNVVLIFALLSMLQATLTLPGIAGIVLTIGMAVDANVLIFERIREEARSGRSVMSAIDIGYGKAMSTIIDSNLTTLIAAILLFSLGSGPIKGFAVTLSIGILTSMFSAIMVTRIMVVTWLKRFNPKELPI